MGNGIKWIVVNKTLKQLGVGTGSWYDFGGITGSRPERRQRWLDKIAAVNFK
ncbi:hypothetical protein [Bifidobacterium aemilianum]|nr:hypothetical protein [Bifidobacterium aemilianum]